MSSDYEEECPRCGAILFRMDVGEEPEIVRLLLCSSCEFQAEVRG